MPVSRARGSEPSLRTVYRAPGSAPITPRLGHRSPGRPEPASLARTAPVLLCRQGTILLMATGWASYLGQDVEPRTWDACLKMLLSLGDEDAPIVAMRVMTGIQYHA